MNVSKNILHRVNLESVGGVEISFAQFLRGADDAAHQVLVHERVHPFFESTLSELGVRLLRRARFKRWYGIRLPAFAAGLRARNGARLLRETCPDLVVAWNNFANMEIANLSRALNRPLVYYEHGNGWNGGRRRERTAKAFLSATRGVICNSQAAIRMLQLRWGYSGHPTVVYCAIGNGFDAPVPTRKISNRPVRLGVAGRLIPLKGVGLALHALAALRREQGLEAQLHIAGTGPAEFSLRDTARRLGIFEQVVFHGLVSDMRSFYDSVDIQLVPSLREPFGRVSIEAQARGCPVVVSGVDGLVETLQPGVSGEVVVPDLPLTAYSALGGSTQGVPDQIYDPQADSLAAPRLPNPSALAAAVVRLCRDNETFNSYSSAARTQALDRFSQDRFVRKLSSTLDEFVGVASF